MRVLNVCASIDPVTGGGTAERTVMMSKFLSLRGTECTILTNDIGLERVDAALLSLLDIEVLPCRRKRFYLPEVSFLRLKAFVAKFDIVHLMSHWTVLNAMIFTICRMLGKPYVVCPAGALHIFGRSRLLKNIYNILVGKRMIRNAHCCIAVTRDEVSLFKDYGAAPENIVVIPNGIDPGSYLVCDDRAFRNKYDLGDLPIVLFVGRLNSIKGPDLLLDAYCANKDIHESFQLVFAGPDGGMLEILQQSAADCGLSDKVRFLGYLGADDKSRAYHAAELLVIPSRHEAMSIVVLEAGICGTPVLLTDQCGLDELQQLDAGRVVAGTVEAIGAGLAELLRDKTLRTLLGTNLRHFVAQEYLWNSVVDKYIDLYKRLIV